jgi:hypothetical protein
MVTLPDKFLRWNYYARRVAAENFLKGKMERDMNKFFLDITWHTPTLCTACVNPDGSISVNGKIVGMGYVLKKKYLSEAIKALKDHISMGDELFADIEKESERIEKSTIYQRRSMELFLKYLYFEPKEATERVDFTKLSTIEMAKMRPKSSKHTWSIVQRCKRASLVFYRPPSLSFELHGQLEIHENGEYHEFVNLVHDAVGYVPPYERRYAERPVYIFNVEAVFDNSPSPTGWGTKIA